MESENDSHMDSEHESDEKQTRRVQRKPQRIDSEIDSDNETDARQTRRDKRSLGIDRDMDSDNESEEVQTRQDKKKRGNDSPMDSDNEADERQTRLDKRSQHTFNEVFQYVYESDDNDNTEPDVSLKRIQEIPTPTPKAVVNAPFQNEINATVATLLSFTYEKQNHEQQRVPQTKTIVDPEVLSRINTNREKALAKRKASRLRNNEAYYERKRAMKKRAEEQAKHCSEEAKRCSERKARLAGIANAVMGERIPSWFFDENDLGMSV